jgi:DNA excision repair protein ERCC-4
LLREKNEVAFVKAFTDQPEHVTSGLAPLRNIVRELRVQHVHIYPRYFLLPGSTLFLIADRFHDEVKQTLEKKRIDIIQLLQGLTESMKEIHGAIIQCINSTMSELKRSHTNVSILFRYSRSIPIQSQLDLDDLNVDNAYFRSFDAIVRRQLDPVWHKVGPRTKQLVGDLATLRRLLT